jgi:hypothetical protein
MCRSDFGKQYGPFEVKIADISLINPPLPSNSSHPSAFLAKFREWFFRMLDYFKSFGRNHNGVRLP